MPRPTKLLKHLQNVRGTKRVKKDTSKAVDAKKKKRVERKEIKSKLAKQALLNVISRMKAARKRLQAVKIQDFVEVERKKSPVIKRHSKPFKSCSRFEKCRRRRELYIALGKLNAKPNDFTTTAEASVGLALKSNTKLSRRQYSAVKTTTKILPCFNSLKKEKAQALVQYGAAEIVIIKSKEGNDVAVRMYDLKSALLARIKWTKFNFPETITVVITGDCGINSTKISFFLPDLPKPLSPQNLSIFAHYFGNDKHEMMKQIFPDILKELPLLKSGIETSQGFKIFQFIIVADYLFVYNILNLQGATSFYYCPFCTITKKDAGVDRTIEQLKQNADNLFPPTRGNRKTKKLSCALIYV